MEQNVLPGAVAKLDDVFLLQFVISLWLDLVVVKIGPVGWSQVNDVGENPREKNINIEYFADKNSLVALSSVLFLLADQSVLEGCVLLATAGVIHGNVANLGMTQDYQSWFTENIGVRSYLSVSSNQVGGLSVDVKCWHHLVSWTPEMWNVWWSQ